MDFSNIDMPKILKSGLKNRFNDFPPKDFEDFITQLFKDNGYGVEQTKYVGDYGADLIIQKDNERIAVQIKRFTKNNKVGVKDANQVLGGKGYYECKNAMIITTSSFTKPVKELAQKTGLDLWDWNKLQKYVCDTYLGGKDYFEYFKESSPNDDSISEPFSFEITNVKYNQLMKGNYEGTLIYVKIKNLTHNNLDTNILELPTFITLNNYQIEARHHLIGYFISGTIYSGCTVESCFIFDSQQLPKVKKGEKMILKLSYSDKTITKPIYVTAERGCFIATAAYGTPFANEIDVLRFWRDSFLLNNYFGKYFVKFYYKNSPHIAEFISYRKILRKIVRLFLALLVKFLKCYYRK